VTQPVRPETQLQPNNPVPVLSAAERQVTDAVAGIGCLNPVAPMQDGRPVGEFLAGAATGQRPTELAWSPAGEDTLTRAESQQSYGPPGNRLETIVPVDSGAGNTSTSGGNAAPTAVLSSALFDAPGGRSAYFTLDSRIPSSIYQTVPVPPG
jgi:hypothetical protein